MGCGANLIGVPLDASNESANAPKITQEPHMSPYRSRNERSRRRNEQHDQATNLDIEEANAGNLLDIF